MNHGLRLVKGFWIIQRLGKRRYDVLLDKRYISDNNIAVEDTIEVNSTAVQIILQIIVRSDHNILKHASSVPRGDTGLVTYEVVIHVCHLELTVQSKVFRYTTCVAIVLLIIWALHFLYHIGVRVQLLSFTNFKKYFNFCLLAHFL